jgi:hypothetical protein
MNNTISCSQETYGNSFETNIGEPDGSSSEAGISQKDSNNSLQYTFHRHSAPKNIIYFRCSDKRCPARLHFDTDKKTFSMKNNHLNAKIHNPPTAKKVITTSQLIADPNLDTRGPLVLDSATALAENINHPDSLIPCKRSSSHILVDSIEEKPFMLKFCTNCPEKISEFQENVVEKSLVTQIVTFSAGKKFTNEKCEKMTGVVIEVYTVRQFIAKVLILINHYFGRGVEVLFYSLD